MQVYETHEDNLITEGVLIFGSGVRLRVVVRVRIPNVGYAISIPVEVSKIQVLPQARRQISIVIHKIPIASAWVTHGPNGLHSSAFTPLCVCPMSTGDDCP